MGPHCRSLRSGIHQNGANEVITEALVLAGGYGTRLGTLTVSCPKVLLPVAGRPFLEYHLIRLWKIGITRVVLAAGYLEEQVTAFRDACTIPLTIDIVHGCHPLDTGGAIKKALPRLGSEFLTLNGDSMFSIDLTNFLEWHTSRQPCVSVALKDIENTGRYGVVRLSGDQIISFEEKHQAPGVVTINGGIYVIDSALFDTWCPEGSVSLERHLFPLFVEKGVLYGNRYDGFLIDIGTPADYERSHDIFKTYANL